MTTREPEPENHVPGAQGSWEVLQNGQIVPAAQHERKSEPGKPVSPDTGISVSDLDRASPAPSCTA
jgi:hypothetical protein